MWRRPPAWWSALRQKFHRDEQHPYLSDDTGFDYPDEAEAADGELPAFNKLRVLVADDIPAINGGALALSSDDDSLLERDTSAPPPRTEPCDSCRQQRERQKDRTVQKRLGLAALLYLLFMVAELLGENQPGAQSYPRVYLGADIPIFFIVEVLSAIISVLLVYILTAFLLYEAVQRTISMDYTINGDVMLITAAVGVAVNLIMGFLLNQAGHPHSHSHSHGTPTSSSSPSSHGHSHGSLAVRAAFVHALGDLAQSIGVLIAAYIIRFKPEYKIADPICTYIFSVLVVFTTLRLIRDTVLIILEGVPRHLNVDQIKSDLMKIEDVHSVKDLNVWSLTTGKSTAIITLQLNPSSSSKWEEVQNKARQILLNTYGMYKCFIQLQSYRQEQSTACANCSSA
ncbi:probable proton-coupled zinc antiporter SLC30A4 [Pyxicephalus adspersus]|uniref:probable proton-coupled zinc antiporter SLC30A4 n=1 Tax=Pyxicephalus adspersus TaxID=30357 RepID=UPI003B5B2410